MLLATVVTFLVLMAMSMPIVFSLGAAAVAGLWIGGYPLQTIASTAIGSSQSWVLLAVPSFIFAGLLMERCGLSHALVELARALVGWLRGGLGMSVIAVRRRAKGEEREGRAAVHPLAALPKLLPQAHALVICLPLTPETEGLIGARELAVLPPSAVLVNSTRGGVLDDAALIEALKNGTLRAAGLDVFEDEPRLNPGFLDLDNVVLTPHIGSSTEATRRAMAMTAATNAVAALGGATPPNLVNPEVEKR